MMIEMEINEGVVGVGQTSPEEDVPKSSKLVQRLKSIGEKVYRWRRSHVEIAPSDFLAQIKPRDAENVKAIVEALVDANEDLSGMVLVAVGGALKWPNHYHKDLDMVIMATDDNLTSSQIEKLNKSIIHIIERLDRFKIEKQTVLDADSDARDFYYLRKPETTTVHIVPAQRKNSLAKDQFDLAILMGDKFSIIYLGDGNKNLLEPAKTLVGSGQSPH